MVTGKINELKRLAEPLASPNGSDSNASWWDSFHRAANPAAILALIAEIDSLRDQVNGLTGELERERKRLDFSLNREGFYDHTTRVFFCDRAFKIPNPQVCRHGILVQAENKCEQCTRAEIAKRLATALAEMLIKKPKP